jgi:hypothetical protein
MIENKIVPITEELSLSSVFIHELLDMTFGIERAFPIIDQSCVEAYNKWKKYKNNLTKEVFEEVLDNEIYKIYIRKIIEERNR